MQFFEGRPGQVVAVADPFDAPMLLRLDDWGGPATMKAAITEIGVVRQVGVQFLHTYADLVFGYVFGDRITPLRIAGVAFADSCDAGPVAGAAAVQTGLERVLAYFQANRAAARARPAQLQIGVGASGYFQGLLVGMTAGTGDPATRLSNFSLDYRVLPRVRG